MKRFLIGICLGFGIWSLGFAPSAEAVEHKWEVGQGTGLTTTEFVVKDARVGINAIRLAVDAGGNVGIGTTEPSAKLQIGSGSTGITINNSSYNIIGLNTANGADNSRLFITGGHNESWANGAVVELRGNEYASGTPDIEIRGGSNGGNVILQTNGTKILLVDSNIGIGTTNPTGKLQVTTLEGAAPSIFVKSDGNVGIGTTGPTATLQVNGRIKDKTGFVLPAGTIVAFGGATTPEGWLMCDGTSYLQSTYPDLYLAIGKAFGGDGSNFNVPDFRGRFLRGVDFPATGRDPESGSRTFEASGGNTGNNVGSVQLDDFKSHVHTTTPTNFFNTAYAQIPGAYGAGSSGTQPTSATGGIETRPVNAYVNYIIKY